MVEIDSSKEEGSSTSAGTKLLKSSIVMFGPGVGVGVGAGRAGVDSRSGSGDACRDGGVLNLTTGFAYGRGRLCDKPLGMGNATGEGGTHASRFMCLTLTTILPSS